MGEASVLGSLERCAGSIGLIGMFGLFSATGCDAEPRGEVTAEALGGVGSLILRCEALGWFAGASPRSERDRQQPYEKSVSQSS